MRVFQGGRKGVDKLISLYGVWFEKVTLGENMPVHISIPTPTWLSIIKKKFFCEWFSTCPDFFNVFLVSWSHWLIGRKGSPQMVQTPHFLDKNAEHLRGWHLPKDADLAAGQQ